MSHIVAAKTSIRNPNRELLRQAVELVAQQHEGGAIREKYLTYQGQERKANTGLALYTNTIHRGIGIQIAKEDGALTFVGDPWGVWQEYEAVQQQIIQTYVSLATMQALQSLGYQPQAIGGENRELVIQGVSYA